ncbi:MAG: formate--tetrahydrofolate ligase [Verrucomicrobiales bacterium]
MSDIEIARNAKLEPIAELAQRCLGLEKEQLIPYGHYKAKIDPQSIDEEPSSKLVLVTAISPTPAGEGKTTTTIGLGDGLRLIGKNATICLREPSLGPSFGMKGGAAGGGYAQVVPMDEINLHFTGDFHAISAANNLLASIIDNHLHWGNKLNIDPRKVTWRRALDLNDRALRQIVVGLGGPMNGLTRETGFDITVASEVMAIFCLATGLGDLKRRLGQIVVGQNSEGENVHARELVAEGSMTALLKDAIQPNLVQTLEKTPAFVHGGPFANIAHGCNSVAATKLAMKLSDIVVTEAGFGADLGAEKFFDIKCRKSGLRPDASVIVATIRALKYHGGVKRNDLNEENTEAVELGFANLRRHLENVAKFGVPTIVALNAFTADTEEETKKFIELCDGEGVKCVLATHWANGGEGAKDLAEEVVKMLESEDQVSNFAPIYPDDMPLIDKLQTVAREIYRADDVELTPAVTKKLKSLDLTDVRNFPVCIAKTPYSFSADQNKRGAVSGFKMPIREVRVAYGAEFVVALAGEIMTMPGLPRVPASERIDVDDLGELTGLS